MVPTQHPFVCDPAEMTAAQAQFRRVKGYRQLPALARVLEHHVGYQPDTHTTSHTATA